MYRKSWQDLTIERTGSNLNFNVTGMNAAAVRSRLSTTFAGANSAPLTGAFASYATPGVGGVAPSSGADSMTFTPFENLPRGGGQSGISSAGALSMGRLKTATPMKVGEMLGHGLPEHGLEDEAHEQQSPEQMLQNMVRDQSPKPVVARDHVPPNVSPN